MDVHHFDTKSWFLVHPALKTHWATQFLQLLLSSATSSTSSQLMPIFLRSFLTTSFQYCRSWPGLLLKPLGSYVRACHGSLWWFIRERCSSHLRRLHLIMSSKADKLIPSQLEITSQHSTWNKQFKNRLWITLPERLRNFKFKKFFETLRLLIRDVGVTVGLVSHHSLGSEVYCALGSRLWALVCQFPLEYKTPLTFIHPLQYSSYKYKVDSKDHRTKALTVGAWWL